MNKQAKLFQDQDVANDDLSLTPVIKKKGRTKLTAAQSEFNRLNRKINELKAEITFIPEKERKIRTFYQEHAKSLFEKETAMKYDYLIYLDGIYEEGKLIKILKADKQDATLAAEGASETTTNPLADLKFVTKYKAGRKLAAHVVVNPKNFLDDITFGTSVDQLNETVSGCLSATDLIKYGTKDIVFGTDVTKHYVSPSDAEQNPNTILVTVSQIAARLDFSQFSVTLNGFEKTPVVTFEEAKFVNLQQVGKIVEGYAGSKVADGISLNCSNSRNQEGATVWTGMGTAYGYANQYGEGSRTNTGLYVKFTVDGRTFEKTYPINPAGGDNVTNNVAHTGIKGGYLYDIKVHWTITPKWGDSIIEFYTKDWVHNTIPEVVL